MKNIPFTVYDFFAYLSSGSVIVAAIDYLYGYQWLMQDEISTPLALLLIFLSYVTGHVVAHASSLLLENLFVDRILRRPSLTLMGDTSRRRLRFFFPGYYRALPKETQERVRAQARQRAFSGSGEALFMHIYGVVVQDESIRKRLDEFRNLYGFSRNLAFAFLAVALMFGLGTHWSDKPPSLWWSVIAVVIGLSMLYRYLKFFRQFSYLLFITYAELPRPNKKGV
jgi:hypothetical protein